MHMVNLKRGSSVERRSEPRHMCAELVRIQLRTAPGDVEEEIANLEEISPSGACIQLDRAVQRGADIEINCHQCKLRGKVRYCRFAGIGYDIGIQFDERGAWSRERFEPEHMLDVSELERAVAAGAAKL
jgi:hypothetical protein